MPPGLIGCYCDCQLCSSPKVYSLTMMVHMGVTIHYTVAIMRLSIATSWSALVDAARAGSMSCQEGVISPAVALEGGEEMCVVVRIV